MDGNDMGSGGVVDTGRKVVRASSAGVDANALAPVAPMPMGGGTELGSLLPLATATGVLTGGTDNPGGAGRNAVTVAES